MIQNKKYVYDMYLKLDNFTIVKQTVIVPKPSLVLREYYLFKKRNEPVFNKFFKAYYKMQRRG